MASWLKRTDPPKGPAEPKEINAQDLHAALGQLEAQGLMTPVAEYLDKNAPVIEHDKWGEPLPLSAVEQDQLDRLYAILDSPAARGRALVTSGMLAPDEADALMSVFPDVWSRLVQQVFREMVESPPPYAAWVEATLSVLFGLPASEVYTKGEPPMKPPPSESIPQQSDTMGTAADRREPAVREQQQRS